MQKLYRVAIRYSEYWGANGPVYFMDAEISFGRRADHDDGTMTIVAIVTQEQHEAAIQTEGVTYLGDEPAE